MTLSKTCCIVFAASVLIVIISLIMSELFRKRYLSARKELSVKHRAILTPLQIFLVGFFISVAVILYPAYYYDYFAAEAAIERVIKSALMSIHNTMRVFILDGDFNIIKDTVNGTNIAIPEIVTAYTVYAAVLFVIAPVMTAGFVMSFFKNISATVKYVLYPRSDIYFMSCLNERSVTLAEDIMTHESFKRRRLVVFADVFEKEEEENFELVNRANRLGAICFRKDITEVSLKSSLRGIKRKLYFIGDDEDENIKQALTMISRCRESEKYNSNATEFYIFSNTAESEVLLNSADNGSMKVRRINQSRNLAWTMLREHSVFGDARLLADGTKHMEIALIGLGKHGTELLKALCWSSQMVGYSIAVHVFTKEEGEENIKSIAPEFIEYNHKKQEGEPFYDICFHDKTDVTSTAFTKAISELKGLTTVYVALGNDELNIETAMKIRMELGRTVKNKEDIPPILSILYNATKSEVISRNSGLKGLENDGYGIIFMGSMTQRYSLEFIEQEKLEELGRKCHLKWSNTESEQKKNEARYEKYEYYRRSSMSEALYLIFRNELGMKSGKSRELDALLAEYEQKRWSAYMRADGYVGGDKKDDIAKTHPKLLRRSLDDKDREKNRVLAQLV